MTEEQKQAIIAISKDYWREADEAKRPIVKMWDKVWALYNNNYDFSTKAEWQSKIFVPKVSDSVRGASSMLKTALIRARDFFTVEATKKEYKDYEIAIYKTIKNWLDKLQFTNLFSEAVTGALLSNLMIFKVFWKRSGITENTWLPIQKSEGADIIKEKKIPKKSLEEEFAESQLPEISQMLIAESPEVAMQMEQQTQDTLKIIIIDPYNFWLDPTGRRKYCIHRSMEDLGDVKDIAKDAGYDIKVLDSIKEDFVKRDMQYKEDVRKGQQPSVLKPTNRKSIMMDEYWGDLYDTDGNIMFRNVTWTMANETYLLRAPMDNPYLFHRKWPFIWGPICKKPFSVYHKSLIEDSIGMAGGITELFNLAIDSNSYATAKAFEIDIDQVYDPEELKSGVYPGKTFKKRSGGNTNPMIKEITLGQVSSQILRVYQELDREYQNATALTEFVMGKPTARGRPTATEVNVKTRQSSSIIEDMALDIEDLVLAPLIDMIYRVVLQYQKNFDDLRMLGLSEEIIKQLQYITTLPNKEKNKYVNAFEFNVRGLSGVIEKQEEIQKILMFIQFLSANPQMAMKINFDKLLKRGIEAFSWDPDDILLTPQEQQAQLQQQLQMQSMLGQGQGQGQGQPEARPGEPSPKSVGRGIGG